MFLHIYIFLFISLFPELYRDKKNDNKFQKTPYIVLHFIIGQNNWTRDTETRTKAGRALPKTGK